MRGWPYKLLPFDGRHSSQVNAIATEQGWTPPSYGRVCQIIKNLDPALVTMAHQGTAAYREEFDLLYRREASHANAMWQADHTPLDVLLLDEGGIPAKPWLTAIEADYSSMIVGYRLSFQKATTLTTALTLRQAICRKEDPRWHAYGIPSVFYSDHGSDFTSKHLELAGYIKEEVVIRYDPADMAEITRRESQVADGPSILGAFSRDRCAMPWFLVPLLPRKAGTAPPPMSGVPPEREVSPTIRELQDYFFFTRYLI